MIETLYTQVGSDYTKIHLRKEILIRVHMIDKRGISNEYLFFKTTIPEKNDIFKDTSILEPIDSSIARPNIVIQKFRNKPDSFHRIRVSMKI